MKLLLDENLSPDLVSRLKEHFPGSEHVRNIGLKGRPDQQIWEFARLHGFTLLSKDSDFQEKALLLGPPPKVIWLRLGNCTTQQILSLILQKIGTIRQFGSHNEESLLDLS